jgi:dienelactone hydrolase
MLRRLASMLAIGSLSLVLAGCQSTVSFPDAPLANDPATPPISGVMVKPAGSGPFPAVVMLHSCGGIKPHLDAGWPEYFTSLGYAVLAVDTFGSRGYGPCPNPLWAFSTLFVKDAYGALDYLARQPFIDANRVAVIGFSVGADHINNALIPWRVRKPGEHDFKAAIAFYGRCDATGSYPEGSIPLMEVTAGNDTYSSGCRNKLTMNPRIEVHVLAGAYHAFDVPGSRGQKDGAGNTMVYSAIATNEAREYARAFLGEHLR